jgi:hypothetical protein
MVIYYVYVTNYEFLQSFPVGILRNKTEGNTCFDSLVYEVYVFIRLCQALIISKYHTFTSAVGSLLVLIVRE